MSRDLNTSNYPGWPESFYTHKPKTPSDPGLFGSGIHRPDISGGPEPEEVRAWKRDRNASVTETCEHFGLSRVQVVKVVGE